MAIEQGIWKIGDKPQKLQPSGLADESLLEEQVNGLCTTLSAIIPTVICRVCIPGPVSAAT